MSEIDKLADMAMAVQSKLPPRRNTYDRGFTPALNDIRYTYGLIGDSRLEMLDDTEFRALMRLIAASAAARVWTYSPPGDGGLPQIKGLVKQYLRMSENKWNKIKCKLIEYEFISIENNKIYLMDSFVEIVSEGQDRPAMPPSLRITILTRDRFTCGYCGDIRGPFDVDHVIPWSRGGDFLSEDNLICACAPCNRAKKDKTVEEWLG